MIFLDPRIITQFLQCWCWPCSPIDQFVFNELRFILYLRYSKSTYSIHFRELKQFSCEFFQETLAFQTLPIALRNQVCLPFHRKQMLPIIYTDIMVAVLAVAWVLFREIHSTAINVMDIIINQKDAFRSYKIVYLPSKNLGVQPKFRSHHQHI